MKALICALIGLTIALPCLAEEDFKDVPKDHWAAESVRIVAQDGIVKGYNDKTYRGDKPITRYELAVTLERLIYFIQESDKPIQTADSKQQSESKHEKQSNPSEFLIKNGNMTSDSTYFQKPNEPVTKEELAQVLSSVAAKLIEEKVPVKSEETSKDNIKIQKQ